MHGTLFAFLEGEAKLSRRKARKVIPERCFAGLGEIGSSLSITIHVKIIRCGPNICFQEPSSVLSPESSI